MNGVTIIKEIGDFSPDTVITEQGLADLLHKHRVSVKRAVSRGELPVPVRLFGEPVWTVQALRDHLNHRLEAAKQNALRAQRRISQLSA